MIGLACALTALLLPVFVANGSASVYGACSTRLQCGQRLVLPTKEAVGHFAQAFGAFLTIALRPVWSAAAMPEGASIALTAVATLVLFVYPVYNLVKRNAPNHGRGLGINNTSYGNNLFDYLLGVWAAVAVGLLIRVVVVRGGSTTRAEKNKGAEAHPIQLDLLEGAIGGAIALGVLSAFFTKAPLRPAQCRRACATAP